MNPGLAYLVPTASPCDNGSHSHGPCCELGLIAESITCLAADTCLTADPRAASSIPARSHTLVEIGHEIISTVILLPSADSRRVFISNK